MKKLTNIASPFILMLVPVFMMIGLLIFNRDIEIPAEKAAASISFQLPALNVAIKSVF